MELQQILSEFIRNPGTSAHEIEEFERASCIRLPADYARFMQVANGGEGPVGNTGYLMLWKLEELAEFNRGYEVDRYAPGLFLFGSDGGGEAFAFDMRFASPPVVSVPFVGMSLELIQPLAPTFEEFLQQQSRS